METEVAERSASPSASNIDDKMAGDVKEGIIVEESHNEELAHMTSTVDEDVKMESPKNLNEGAA